jgi:hypothetical protein
MPGFRIAMQLSLPANDAVNDKSAADQQYRNSQPQKDDRHHFLLRQFYL